MNSEFAQMRAVRPLPLANGWIRTHSACAHAQRSITFDRPSSSSSLPFGYRASKISTALRRLCSNAFNSSATLLGGTPSWRPIRTPVVSRPCSPRKRPTYLTSGTSRPAIVSHCHWRAASIVGTSLRLALSRTACRTWVRFLPSRGLSASQSATKGFAHHRLSWCLFRSSLSPSVVSLYWSSLNGVGGPKSSFPLNKFRNR